MSNVVNSVINVEKKVKPSNLQNISYCSKSISNEILTNSNNEMKRNQSNNIRAPPVLCTLADTCLTRNH